MLHIAIGNIGSGSVHTDFQPCGGFTLLEMILVFGIASLLVLSLLSIFLNGLTFYHEMAERSEKFHHLRTGLQTLVTEVESAVPQTIVLKEGVDSSTYTEIEFDQYGSDSRHWFYVNSAKTLIHAIQKPGESWGKLVIADGVEQLSITVVVISSQTVNLLKFTLTSLVNHDTLVVETTISPGF